MTAIEAPPSSDEDSSGHPTTIGPVQVGPMTRRSLLHHIGVGAATVLVAGIGVGSYRVFDNGVLDAGAGTAYDAWANWRADRTPLGAVAAAILAANPHNTQPWIFHVTADRIELFADRTRRTGSLDALDREHHVGLGCALENLVLAASARGHRATVKLLPDATDSTHVATVALVAGSVAPSTLHDAIGRRHSNRGPYTTAAVPADVLSALDSVSAGLDGVSVRWFSTPTDRTALGVLIIDATQAIVDDEQQSKDSFAWFRNSGCAGMRQALAPVYGCGSGTSCCQLVMPTIMLCAGMPLDSTSHSPPLASTRTVDANSSNPASPSPVEERSIVGAAMPVVDASAGGDEVFGVATDGPLGQQAASRTAPRPTPRPTRPTRRKARRSSVWSWSPWSGAWPVMCSSS